MTSREAILRPVILRLTLESPIMEKSLEIDIAKLSFLLCDWYKMATGTRK